jgi:meso-butanediol dehydrogenase/(S,S)-butanediol dehydrogenase/diacetyl reductase
MSAAEQAAGGRLAGRVVVVTGGGSGIGAAIARGCADHGARVAVADRDRAAAAQVAESIGAAALPVVLDVTDRSSVGAGLDEAIAAFGRLDVVFNNAGVNVPMRFLDITEDNFRRLMDVNALGVLIGTQEAARRFLAQAPSGSPLRGKVVNTASIAGRTGFPDFAPYSASKAAVISLTQAAARALASDGVTVNAFSPGVVATPLWKQLDADLTRIGAGDAGFDSMAGDILLGRPAEPADIVPTAVFLASADSDYITGQVVAVDGGMVLV